MCLFKVICVIEDALSVSRETRRYPKLLVSMRSFTLLGNWEGTFNRKLIENLSKTQYSVALGN